MEQYKCYICKFQSTNQTMVKEHFNISHNIKVDVKDVTETFICPQCSYTNDNIADLRKHMTSVHAKDAWNWGLDINMKFLCRECDMEFSTNSTLRRHIKSGHKEVIGKVIVEVTLYCDFCHETFNSKKDLCLHIGSKHSDFIKT